MTAMSVACSSVFRTANTIRRPATHAQLAVLQECCTPETAGFTRLVIAPLEPNRNLMLENLASSSGEITSRELLKAEIRFEARFLASLQHIIEQDATPFLIHARIDQRGIQLFFYEDFMLLLEFMVHLEVDLARNIPDRDGLRHFEQRVNLAVKAMMAELEGRYRQLLTKLQENGAAPKSAITPPLFMWTSRTALLPNAPGIPEQFHARWSETEKTPGKFNDDSHYFISWGNSSIYGANPENFLIAFEDIKRKLQYIYTGIFILREDTEHFFSDLIKQQDRITEPRIHFLRQREIMLFKLENALSELDFFYQGTKHAILEEFIAEWRLRQLTRDVYAKIERANKLLSYIYHNRRARIQGRLKSLLFAIGTVEILGVFIELIDLSDSPEIDRRRNYGIVALIRYLNPGILLTWLVGLLAILAIFILITGTQEKTEE